MADQATVRYADRDPAWQAEQTRALAEEAVRGIERYGGWRAGYERSDAAHILAAIWRRLDAIDAALVITGPAPRPAGEE